MAGLRGDGWNLGFVVETERQVEAHLDEHLQTLPGADLRSRAILTTMKADEARHADNAEQAGARILPQPIPTRSEEHTSELQSLMRISYAVFCLKKPNRKQRTMNY